MRPRILIVHSTLHIGGAEEVTANLCRHIDRDLFDVAVCYLKEKGMIGDKIEASGTEVFGIPRRDSIKTDYFTSLKLWKVIRERKISLVHTHDVHSLADATLCRITTPGLRLVHTFHYGRYPNRDKPFRTIESICWRFVDAPVAVSSVQAQGLSKLYRIPNNKLNIVWNGVNVTPSDKVPELIDKAHKSGRTVIGCINTLIEQKGMYDLIETALIMKRSGRRDFVFLIAGDGHLKKPLIQRVKELNLDAEVKFIGWVEDAACVMMRHVDIFFQPSLWEAMSIVLLEAMANSRPIVATSVGETPLIVSPYEHALLVKPEDHEGMAAALTRLLDDKALAAILGSQSRVRYLESFTASAMAERYMKLYNDLLADN